MMVVDSNPDAHTGRVKSAWYHSAPPVGSGIEESFCVSATAILMESRHSLESGTSVLPSHTQENWQTFLPFVAAILLCLITSQRFDGKRGSMARLSTTRPTAKRPAMTSL